MEYYWVTKTGKQIKVDDMSIEHLRNTLKMLIRNSSTITKTIEINGDIAQSMIDDGYLDDYEEQMGMHDELYYLNF